MTPLTCGNRQRRSLARITRTCRNGGSVSTHWLRLRSYFWNVALSAAGPKTLSGESSRKRATVVVRPSDADMFSATGSTNIPARENWQAGSEQRIFGLAQDAQQLSVHDLNGGTDA